MKTIFTGCRIVGWPFFSFQYFKDVAPVSSHLYYVQWKIYFGPHFCSSVHMCLFFPLAFLKGYFFIMYMNNVFMMCHSSYLLYLYFNETLHLLICSFHLIQIILQIVISVFHPFLWWLQCVKLSHSSLILLFFFSLCFISDSLHCYAFKFSHIFFYSIWSIVKPI